jgi:protein phosphatase PTC7
VISLIGALLTVVKMLILLLKINLPTALVSIIHFPLILSKLLIIYNLGIADGVGGWGDIGVDPSQFAWELMNNAQGTALKQEQEIDPQVVLDNAYKTLVSEGNVEAGSSTACILSVDKVSGIIKSSNLGDSGYLIIRNHTPLYRSRENTHYFNAPYQLSIVPPELDRGNNIKNTPADADQDSYQLEHGDFVVLGTDGLFDNLFNEEIISTIDLAPPPNLDVANCTDNSVIRMKIQNMASELVKKSKQVANDKTKMTPFSKAAQEHGYRYSGGKIDDITVVVLYVDMAGQNQLKPHI